MRHIMRGALGAVVVYPLIWHYWPREVALPVTTAATAAPVPSADRAAPAASPAPVPRAATRSLAERLPALATPEPSAVAEPSAPSPPLVPAPAAPEQPSLQPPRDPLAELGKVPELRETLARAAEIQQHAANPAELERAVQSLDEDPAKIARLKALADMFVQLPPQRGDAYLPSSGSSGSSRAGR